MYNYSPQPLNKSYPVIRFNDKGAGDLKGKEPLMKVSEEASIACAIFSVLLFGFYDGYVMNFVITVQLFSLFMAVSFLTYLRTKH